MKITKQVVVEYLHTMKEVVGDVTDKEIIRRNEDTRYRDISFSTSKILNKPSLLACKLLYLKYIGRTFDIDSNDYEDLLFNDKGEVFLSYDVKDWNIGKYAKIITYIEDVKTRGGIPLVTILDNIEVEFTNKINWGCIIKSGATGLNIGKNILLCSFIVGNKELHLCRNDYAGGCVVVTDNIQLG